MSLLRSYLSVISKNGKDSRNFLSTRDKNQGVKNRGMKLQDLLNCKSLQGADLIVGSENWNLPVTGINILEAPDIEKWGKPGMVILTSYFALQSHTGEELQSFIHKVKELGIACIIIKVNRLVSEIPAQFIDLCKTFGIPLIRISGATKYEDIIVEVLTFILGIREQRLALYYQVSKIGSEMALEMLSLREILLRFKTFLGFDMTLMEKGKHVTISTNKQLVKFAVESELELFHSEYMNFSYHRYQCLCDAASSQKYPTVVLVEFSIEDTSETLAIHETQKHQVDEDDIVVIENLIRCLQLNLLREYSGKQKLMWDKNTLVNDLLRGMINDPVEFATACAELEIDPEGSCQVFTIDFAGAEGDDQITLYAVKNRLRSEIQRIHRNLVYYTTPRYDQYILSSAKRQPAYFDAAQTNALITRVIAEERLPERIRFYGGLSDVFPVSEIAAAGTQSKSVADFLSHHAISNSTREYRNLGLFKLFLGKEKVKLADFVPDELIRLRSDSEELFTTLCVYLKNNRNLKQTANELYLHPKTVKYRIDKINRSYMLSLDNIHSITLILASIEIMEFQKNKGALTTVNTPQAVTK